MQKKTKQSRRRRGIVPSYVSITRLAAELEITMPTVHAWLREGRLPPPDPGFPASSRRWRWTKVQSWMAGDHSDDLFIGRGKPRGPRPGAPHAGRPRTVDADDVPVITQEEMLELTRAVLDDIPSLTAEEIDAIGRDDCK